MNYLIKRNNNVLYITVHPCVIQFKLMGVIACYAFLVNFNLCAMSAMQAQL